jgi:phage shock protein A
MSNVVRNAVLEQRKELADRANLLKSQWQEVKDNLQARKTELDQIQADIAEIDAWVLVNPAVVLPA